MTTQKTFIQKEVNGHQFQLLTLPGTNFFKYEIVNKFGSNIERVYKQLKGKNVYGISHFVEHLGFRAPQDYTTEKLIELLRTEGTHNASTDHNRINYFFKTTMERIDIAIRLVCNYAFNDLKGIPLDEFETEKKVVCNEVKRYADDDQTMFGMDFIPITCGYHQHDNILGVPEVIDNFTLQDAINIKEIFLAAGEHTHFVTYDPTILSEEEVVSKIETEFKRFELPTLNDVDWKTEYAAGLSLPKIGNYKISNDSEQAMTSIIIDINDNLWTARTGNAYLSHYATNTSLNDVIREQHGLTYGIYFGDNLVAYTPYNTFMCDVTRGTEEKLMELFVESINKSVDAFNKQTHESLINTIKLKRSMRYVNQENYNNLHWLALWNPELINHQHELFSIDSDKALHQMDNFYASYDRILNYLENIRNKVNNKEYVLVTN